MLAVIASRNRLDQRETAGAFLVPHRGNGFSNSRGQENVVFLRGNSAQASSTCSFHCLWHFCLDSHLTSHGWYLLWNSHITQNRGHLQRTFAEPYASHFGLCCDRLFSRPSPSLGFAFIQYRTCLEPSILSLSRPVFYRIPWRQGSKCQWLSLASPTCCAGIASKWFTALAINPQILYYPKASGSSYTCLPYHNILPVLLLAVDDDVRKRNWFS